MCGRWDSFGAGWRPAGFITTRFGPQVGITHLSPPLPALCRGLTGWVAYAYAQTRLQDQTNNLSFVSDFDQRHTLNAYGSYRFTETFDLSGQWRYGSGMPIPGFLRREGATIFLGSERNLLRVPAYSRVDVRANKAFLFKKWKLTLAGEILNLLNHKNEYHVESSLARFRATGRYLIGLRESFRLLPAAGVVIEF